MPEAVSQPVSAKADRLPYVDMLRIFAAFCVALSHLCDVERKYDPAPILPDRLNWGVFGVDMFFVISGYLMVVIARRRGDTLRPLPYLADRAARIYPLYWLITTALVVVWLYRPDLVFASNPNPSIWKSYLLWPNSSDPLHALGYSLTHFMFFYIMFALITTALKPRRIITGLLIWAAALGAIVIAQHLMDAVPNRKTPELRVLTHPYAFSFIMGGLAAGIPKIKPLAVAAAVIGGAAVLFSLFGAQYVFDYNMKMDEWGRVVFRALPFAVLIYGAGSFSKAPFSSPFQRQLADMAFAIFLVHVLTFSLIGRLWAPFASPAPWDNIIAFAVMAVFTLGVSWAAYVLVERPACQGLRHLWRKRPTQDRVI